MFLFLTETSRKMVSNGSIRSPKYLELPVPCLFRHWKENHIAINSKREFPNPFRSLTILLRKDNAVITLACGLLYVAYTCINASLSVLFIDIYHLNQWQAGLVYLPFGLGGVTSTLFTGRLMDKAYRLARTEQGLPTDVVGGDDLEYFSIEKARLRVIWPAMLLTCISVVAFGWVLERRQVSCSPS